MSEVIRIAAGSGSSFALPGRGASDPGPRASGSSAVTLMVVRAWASKHPQVFRAFVDAENLRAGRVTATRAASPGHPRDGFRPGTPEHAEFQRITGTSPQEPIGPRILADGTLRIVAGCPGAWRRQEAARIAAKGGR